MTFGNEAAANERAYVPHAAVEEVSSVLRAWMSAAGIPTEARRYLLAELVGRQPSPSSLPSAS